MGIVLVIQLCTTRY